MRGIAFFTPAGTELCLPRSQTRAHTDKDTHMHMRAYTHTNVLMYPMAMEILRHIRVQVFFFKDMEEKNNVNVNRAT